MMALLGSTKPNGLPTDLFPTEQAHGVGVQVSEQVEQPRVLLVCASYALNQAMRKPSWASASSLAVAPASASHGPRLAER